MRSHGKSSALLLLAVLSTGACGGGVPAEPKVLLIGIDGVRPDVLEAVPTPNLDRLIALGAYTDSALTGVPSLSGPSWTSMLTGVWREKHGIDSNDFPFPDNRLAEYPDFLTRMELERPELTTYAVVDWRPLASADAGGPILSGEVDIMFIFDGYELGWAEADRRSMERAVDILRDEAADAAFVYFGNPDEVSHESRSIGAAYRSAIARADTQVGRLMDAVRLRPRFRREDWLIVVSTDHGRRNDGGHGGDSVEERTIFIIAARVGAHAERIRFTRPGAITDIAPTILAHLGFDIRPEWELDGAPLFESDTRR